MFGALEEGRVERVDAGVEVGAGRVRLQVDVLAEGVSMLIGVQRDGRRAVVIFNNAAEQRGC